VQLTAQVVPDVVPEPVEATPPAPPAPVVEAPVILLDDSEAKTDEVS
jgi:hypothetical protein